MEDVCFSFLICESVTMIEWCCPVQYNLVKMTRHTKETRIVALPFDFFFFFFLFLLVCSLFWTLCLELVGPICWDHPWCDGIGAIHRGFHESTSMTMNPQSKILGLCFIGDHLLATYLDGSGIMTFYFCYWCFVKLPDKIKVSPHGNHRELLCAPIVLPRIDPWNGGLYLSLGVTGPPTH